MKRRFVVVSCCVVLGLASATAVIGETQVRDCSNCVFGIFDDQEMTRTEGFWFTVSPLKVVWVGIQYDPEFDLDGLSGIELSIDGLHQLPEGSSVTFDVKHNPRVVLGSDIATPPPTAGPDAEGGINAAWGECLTGDRELIEVRLFSFRPLTETITLTVRRKFPSADPEAQVQLFTDCNDPIFEKILVGGGTYTLTPVAVEGNTWSGVKSLYR